MTMDYSLWSEASRDVEAENEGRRLIAAKIATSDFWQFLAGAESPGDFTNRLALIQDRLDSAVAATLPEDADSSEVLGLSARVCGSLIHDWEATQRTTLVREAMRKGAPFADYTDFKDCTSKNSDKDDPEAYCGKIQHQTEDSKTSRLASLFALSERDQAAFDTEIAKVATTTPPPHGDRSLMYHPPGLPATPPRDMSNPENSVVEHAPASPTEGGHDEASFWENLKNHLVSPPHDPFALHSSKTAGEIGGPSQQPFKQEMDEPGWYIKSPEGYSGPFPSKEKAQADVDEWGDIATERGETVVQKSSKTAGDVPPEFLEQQKKKSDDTDSDSDKDSDSDTKDDKGSGDSGPGSAKWKEQQDGTNGDSKADPDDDGKAEDGSSNSAQKDDDSDGDDDKKSDGPPPWVKNKTSSYALPGGVSVGDEVRVRHQPTNMLTGKSSGEPRETAGTLEGNDEYGLHVREYGEGRRSESNSVRREIPHSTLLEVRKASLQVEAGGDEWSVSDEELNRIKDEKPHGFDRLQHAIDNSSFLEWVDRKLNPHGNAGLALGSSFQVEADNEAPYRLQGDGPYKVVNSNGDVKGTHDTREEALAQQRALYANVPGAREKAEADEKKKSSLDTLLVRSASLVTALGEQFTTDNPFTPGGSGGGTTLPSTAQPSGAGAAGGGMPSTSPPEARPWEGGGGMGGTDPSAGAPAGAPAGMGGAAPAMPVADMSATPNTTDQTTQDTDSLQQNAARTASVDKVARITAGVLATNPGMDPATARSIAEETLLRYPGRQKD